MLDINSGNQCALLSKIFCHINNSFIPSTIAGNKKNKNIGNFGRMIDSEFFQMHHKTLYQQELHQLLLLKSKKR